MTIVEIARDPERARQLINKLLEQHDEWRKKEGIMDEIEQEVSDNFEGGGSIEEGDLVHGGAPVLPTIFDDVRQVVPDYVGKWQLRLHSRIYHADHAALSHTGLSKAIVNPGGSYAPMITPAHFLAYWLGKKKDDEEQTKAQRIGTLTHLATLERDVFDSTVRVQPDFGDLRKKEPKAAKADWLQTLAPDHVVVKQAEHDMITAMAAAIREHKRAASMLTSGIAEATGYFVDKRTGILCRCRPDFMNEAGWMIDLKTTTDASDDVFARQIFNNSYDTQGAFYMQGAKAITGEMPKGYAIVAVEKDPPYAVVVHVLDTEVLSRAFDLVNSTLEMIRESIVSGIFPAYGEHARLVGLPPHMRRQNGEAF